MARRTASALNAFLHGVCSDDFESGDQHALQDVFFDYFTDELRSNNDSTNSDSDSSEDDTIHGPAIMRYRSHRRCHSYYLAYNNYTVCYILFITVLTLQHQLPMYRV